jgi:hypothetical protein
MRASTLTLNVLNGTRFGVVDEVLLVVDDVLVVLIVLIVLEVLIVLVV